jgi:cobalt-zinc-cadmium efflux system protein
MTHSHHDHAHDDSHAHGRPEHGHPHGHVHATPTHDRAFAIGFALNAGFIVAEVAAGLAAGSMALLADAAHNLGDVLGLLLAWAASRLARLPPTQRRTYGWGRSSILAALANAVLLLISVGAIGVEAIQRLIWPQPVAAGLVMLVAAIGIVVNGVTALMFMRGRDKDLNIRGQFQHMAADAGISFGVVVAALLIRLTDWQWVDPLASLGIAAVITAGTWGLLRESADLAMDAVPGGVSREAVQDYLATLPGVAEVHDLHIWGLSTTEVAMTAHLVCLDQGAPALPDLSTELSKRFGIGHATLQIESHTDAGLCRLRPHDVV